MNNIKDLFDNRFLPLLSVFEKWWSISQKWCAETSGNGPKAKVRPHFLLFLFPDWKKIPSVLQYTANKIHDTIPIEVLSFTVIGKDQILESLSGIPDKSIKWYKQDFS